VALLTAFLVSIVPGELATGYIFPAGQASCVPGPEYPELQDNMPDPVTWCWDTYSDIIGDLSCKDIPAVITTEDNGLVHRAAELGYANQLLDMDPSGNQGTNILLLGIDTRTRGRGRSDCIMVLRVEPEVGILTLSIPRDVKVPMNPALPNGYQDKIAHMYVYGGTERTKVSIENLLGIRVDNHVVVRNLSDFNRLISLIRGVDIDKHLEGDLALKWVRNRGFARGDLERSMRAQLFVKAAIEKCWRLTDGGDSRLTGILVKTALLFVETDLTSSDVMELVGQLSAKGFTPSGRVFTGHLDGRPSRFYSPALDANLAFIEPDRSQLKHFQRLFSGEVQGDRVAYGE
jgi:anionic cell wall polymer biosynthesis LytR-Cps2A-Psr (LCP) family protein